jgi:hypothetical protein
MDPTRLEVGQAGVNVPEEGGTLFLVGPLGANQRPHVVARAGEFALGHALFDVVFEGLRQRDVDGGCAHAGSACSFATLFVKFPNIGSANQFSPALLLEARAPRCCPAP